MGNTMIDLKCSQCGCDFKKSIGHYNRAMKEGLNVYCSRVCGGIGRRKNFTIDEKKRLKSEYDRKRRIELGDELLAKRLEYYYENRDKILASQTIYRKKHMQRHVEYCRQPEYREYKKGYDKKYNAKKNYGEFYEAALIVNDIETIVDSREVFREKKKYLKSTTQKKRKNGNQKSKRN